ncbi:hypothetical protein SK128_019742, partial [Halocaridina rubra]
MDLWQNGLRQKSHAKSIAPKKPGQIARAKKARPNRQRQKSHVKSLAPKKPRQIARAKLA